MLAEYCARVGEEAIAEATSAEKEAPLPERVTVFGHELDPDEQERLHASLAAAIRHRHRLAQYKQTADALRQGARVGSA